MSAEGHTKDQQLEVIKTRIRAIRDLPTLPAILAQVVALQRKPDSSMSDFAAVIGKDPSLSAKILKVANSSFYGIPRRVDNLQQALVILGINEVSNIVTGVSVYSIFPSVPGKETFDLEAFWLHSMGCGVIARLLSTKFKIRSDGREFVSGLLHDIGKLALDQYFHEEFTEIYNASLRENISMYEAEKKRLGVTHCEVGSWLAGEWSLPESLVDAIANHHTPRDSQVDPLTTAITHLADILCKMSSIGFGGDDKGVELKGDPAWRIIREKYHHIESLDLERFTFELEGEIEKAKALIHI